MKSEISLEATAKRFHFTGQPSSEWPDWMIFMNYGYDGHSRIVLHLYEGTLVVNLGDTVVRYQHQVVEISSNKILRFPERSPTLEEGASVEAA
jgi:hypothetical protein